MLTTMQGTLLTAINYFFELLYILIFIRILLSWIRINPQNFFIQLIYQLTEPILGPARALLQKSALGGKGMMLDFSPIIAILLLQIIKMILVSIIQLL
jgi:YggT family protein